MILSAAVPSGRAAGAPSGIGTERPRRRGALQPSGGGAKWPMISAAADHRYRAADALGSSGDSAQRYRVAVIPRITIAGAQVAEGTKGPATYGDNGQRYRRPDELSAEQKETAAQGRGRIW
jgi:hypothetical protein